MSDTVIKVENLSKQYRLGVVGTGTLSHDLNRWWHRVRGKEDPYLKVGETNIRESEGTSQYVWALKDINFEVKQGEVLGIIGKNGAGKSTLLKILSKVTGPTTGNIKAKGRIASLLEVGTGFHPELTGRENIYLNGAILGMTKAEVRSKIDEIIDFAGVVRYVDTPVKRYSSGMKVRLGFAVAAHLEPEILIVDEVLAVGDAEFQKKAVGKMQEVSHEGGRTVLFVSHNMQSITTLTKKCIVLNDGQLSFMGNTSQAIDQYLRATIVNNEDYINNDHNSSPKISSLKVHTSHKGKVHKFGEALHIEVHLYTPYKLNGASFSFQVVNKYDVPIIHLWSFDSERPMCREKGVFVLHCYIPRARLYMGEYSINAYYTGPPNGEKFDIIKNVCPFRVEMYENYREFRFQPDTCAYIEDAEWEISQK